MYKIMLYVFKSLNDQAPSYLTHVLNLYNVCNGGNEDTRRRLRSSTDATRHFVPRFKRQAGDNSFRVCGP